MNGIVKWWDVKRGFGFIMRTEQEGTDVFVHHADIAGRDKTLRIGETVSFDLVDSNNGPKAANVKHEAV